MSTYRSVPRCVPTSLPCRLCHCGAADFKHRSTDLRTEGRDYFAKPELHSSPHTLAYRPPPLKQLELTKPPPPPTTDYQPPPPRRQSEVTAVTDTANHERFAGRPRRQREHEGLAPFEVSPERTWAAHKFASDFQPDYWKHRTQAERLQFHDSGVTGRVTTEMHGPVSMRRPGLWARLRGAASLPDLATGRYLGGLTAAAATDATRAGEGQLQQQMEALKAKIADKFRTAHRAFRTIDTDHSGVLSYDEIVAAVRHFNLPLSDTHVRQLCERADVNGDGNIDYDEFARAVEQMAGSGDLIDFTGRETFEDTRGGVKQNVEAQRRLLGSSLFPGE